MVEETGWGKGESQNWKFGRGEWGFLVDTMKSTFVVIVGGWHISGLYYLFCTKQQAASVVPSTNPSLSLI